MHRRGRAGQVVDAVGFHVQREGDVVAHHLEVVMVHQVRDVALAAGEVVVHTDDIVAVLQQPLAQVRTEKAGAAGDQDPVHVYLRVPMVARECRHIPWRECGQACVMHASIVSETATRTDLSRCLCARSQKIHTHPGDSAMMQ